MEVANLILLKSVNDPEIRAAIERSYGSPVFLEAKGGAQAIDLNAILTLIQKFLPLLPLILGLFTGGFSPATLAALIQAILTALGVQPSKAP